MQSSCYLHDLPIYSHDAPTMTLRKSQGVSALTMQLSCKYVLGPCSILDAHLNRFSKECDVKSCYVEASVFVEHGPKIWD